VEAGWAGRRPRPSGEGGQRLGLGGGGPREDKGEWVGGRSHGPGGKRKEDGPKSLLGAEIQGSKRKSNFN
jgi:hypothetical protein